MDPGKGEHEQRSGNRLRDRRIGDIWFGHQRPLGRTDIQLPGLGLDRRRYDDGGLDDRRWASGPTDRGGYGPEGGVSELDVDLPET